MNQSVHVLKEMLPPAPKKNHQAPSPSPPSPHQPDQVKSVKHPVYPHQR